ncbi:MAG: DUF192 domain-containing protein [Herminiimonas sp.]|nr:DUF192 domain-containing protein [Herminiimonas sp.]
MNPISSLIVNPGAATGQALDLRIAGTFLSRLRGLMFASPLKAGQGMLLLGCTGVHTGFMRQAIDIVYLDSEGIATRCVKNVPPWRASGSRHAHHTLELANGAITTMQIVPGSRLLHPALAGLVRKPDSLPVVVNRLPKVIRRQRGSAMIEFAVVGPIITLLGLATLQYGMLFFAKNQFNHASFMAARAGSTGNAKFSTIQDAYTRALIPLYAKGTTAADLQDAYADAGNAVSKYTRIEVLNPTQESFADFNDEALQKQLGIGGTTPRVIPNGGLAFRHASVVRASSGQNIQDANLLKLRITHGFKLKVPLMGLIYSRYLQWLDTGASTFNTEMIKDQRIPVVTHVTLRMQSDAIEDQTVSTPGMGNGGTPTNPGDPPANSANPPACGSIACTAPITGTGGGPGDGAAGNGAGPGEGTTPGGPCFRII